MYNVHHSADTTCPTEDELFLIRSTMDNFQKELYKMFKDARTKNINLGNWMIDR